jgi:hypothetical protein
VKPQQPNNQTAVIPDEKTAIEKSTTKSNLKRTKDDKESIASSTKSFPFFFVKI